MTTPPPADVAVITGGAGGLGLACARRLAASGPVLLADRSQTIVDTAIEALRSDGLVAEGAVCDVIDREATVALAARCGRLGRLRAVVHTAGVWDTNLPGQEIFEINYGGTVNVLDAFAPLAERGTAAVCLASIGGHRLTLVRELDTVLTEHRGPGLWEALRTRFDVDDPVVAYAVAKRGVIVECEVRSSAWTRRSARLISISPGNFDTPMGRQGRSSNAANHALATAIDGRPGQPNELAAIVEFLTSSSGAYISGCDLRVDGGAVAALRHDPEWTEVFSPWDRVLERRRPR
jgi:NAD(P)-dependent dehydrogenase (short-subunit alcohol dehydrogenase family)